MIEMKVGQRILEGIRTTDLRPSEAAERSYDQTSLTHTLESQEMTGVRFE